jgi:hypothetical protein
LYLALFERWLDLTGFRLLHQPRQVNRNLSGLRLVPGFAARWVYLWGSTPIANGCFINLDNRRWHNDPDSTTTIYPLSDSFPSLGRHRNPDPLLPGRRFLASRWPRVYDFRGQPVCRSFHSPCPCLGEERGIRSTLEASPLIGFSSGARFTKCALACPCRRPDPAPWRQVATQSSTWSKQCLRFVLNGEGAGTR